MRDMLTVSQAAAELGISPERVRQLIDAGVLPAEAVNPRLYLIRRADLTLARARSTKRGPKPRPKEPPKKKGKKKGKQA